MSQKCPIARMRCPQSHEGCPCWTELVEENPRTGETRVTKDCLFRVLPRLMVEVIKASNRPAAAVEDMRNHMIQGLGAIAGSVEKVQRLPGKTIDG